MKVKIAIIISIIILYVIFRESLTLDNLLLLIESIQQNPFAPILFIGIYALAVTMLIPALALTLLGGTLFGFWWGLIYVIIASNIGCHMSYFLARALGRDFVMKFIKEGSFIDSATTKAKENGFIFMMYVRLIPLFPFGVVNYLSGIVNIKYRDYALATFIGMIPGSAVYTYLGYSASSIQDNPLGLIVSIAVLVVFTLIVTIVQRKKQHA